jgi:ferredoxin
MAAFHRVTVYDRQRGETHSADLPEGTYVLEAFEALGTPLPFSCRNGVCTTCAVKVLEGNLEQPEALGLSRSLKEKGYVLLCVAKVCGAVVAETQSEDEVYMLQFGQVFARGRVRKAIPLEEH